MSATFNADPKIQEKTRHLIANGNTSDALLLLFENGFDQAINLKTRLDAAQEQFEAKRTDFGAWSMLQNQVNFEILAMLNPEIDADTQCETVEKQSEGKPLFSEPVPKAVVLDLLDQNKIAEALELCENLGTDQIMLKARYHAGRKYVLLGLVSEETWSRQEKQIQYGIQELIKNVADGEMSALIENKLKPPNDLKPKKTIKTILDRIRDLLRD